MNPPQEPMTLLANGIAAERTLAVAEAMCYYRAALALLPVQCTEQRVELSYRIGSLETRMGNNNEALSAFSLLDSACPTAATTAFFANRHYYQGVIAIRRGELDHAARELGCCLELMPEHTKARELRRRLGTAEAKAGGRVSTYFAAPTQTTVYDLFPEIDRYRAQSLPDVRDKYFNHVWESIKPYTLLPIERIYSIFLSCRYIAQSRVPGDFVECGVYLGGSIIAAALFCEYFGVDDRRFYIFDTFCGFPDSMEDVDLTGRKTVFSAMPHFFDTHFRNIVEKNIQNSGVDPEHFILLEGLVEETLSESSVPDVLAYARLDTDYYRSTIHELNVLWPRLQPGGVLIIDDYGHFEGARKAVDEFFSEPGRPVLLHRIDYSSRSAVKCTQSGVKAI